jgi:hypothetical protein
MTEYVPREQYEQLKTDWFWQSRELAAAVASDQAARAERDALAHVIERARRTSAPDVQSSWRDRAAEVDAILYASTAESDLALHDAEVKAQALDDAAEAFATGEWSDAFATEYVEDDVSAVQATEAWLTARSAAIRAEAK